MATAQMTQSAPRMMDVRPPMPAPQTQSSAAQAATLQPQIVNDLPVQAQSTARPGSFNPIMSSESHENPGQSDHVLSAASQAVQHQHAEPVNAKGRSAKQKSPVRQTSNGPKPVLETVLLVTGSLIACAVVAVIFSNS